MADAGRKHGTAHAIAQFHRSEQRENASENRWLFGSVEDSPSASGNGRPNYYTGQFWLYIIDRQGRIVWYNNPANNASSSFQRIARDGQYIWVDQGRVGDQGVVKMTLDREYFETIDVPVGDAIDVTNDGMPNGNVLANYGTGGVIREITPDKFDLASDNDAYNKMVCPTSSSTTSTPSTVSDRNRFTPKDAW